MNTVKHSMMDNNATPPPTTIPGENIDEKLNDLSSATEFLIAGCKVVGICIAGIAAILL